MREADPLLFNICLLNINYPVIMDLLPGIQISLLADRLCHGLGLLVLLSALRHFFDGILQLSLNRHQLIRALVTAK